PLPGARLLRARTEAGTCRPRPVRRPTATGATSASWTARSTPRWSGREWARLLPECIVRPAVGSLVSARGGFGPGARHGAAATAGARPAERAVGAGPTLPR